MKNKIEKKLAGLPVRYLLFLFIGLSILIVVLFSLKSSPEFVERNYSRQLFPMVRNFLQLLFNWIPFSIGDIFYILLGAFILWKFFLAIIQLFRKHFRLAGKSILSLIIIVQILLITFYSFWALNYFRTDAASRFGLSERDYTELELQNTARLIIDSMNTLRAGLSPEELLQSFPAIAKEAELSIEQLPAEFRSKTLRPKVKASLLSPVMNYLGTAGYFNPFTAEAQVNTNLPIYSSAFIACHELAHQLGSGAEDEASFVGYVAAIKSSNKLLRYSAYYNAGQEFMQALWLSDSTKHKQLKHEISPEVMQDLIKEREFWLKYQGRANQLTSIFYDNYLKANKQPQGLKTYNQMVRLTISYYRKRPTPARLDYISGSSVEE